MPIFSMVEEWYWRKGVSPITERKHEEYSDPPPNPEAPFDAQHDSVDLSDPIHTCDGDLH